MIPVSLTIKGLYSYQEEQEIDFNKLTEGQLFGIFGAVGSGKSSILEAISFALYGETERLNRAENRGYNMMNLKSDELLIDFVFRNYDQQQYRFIVRGRRNKKTFEKVDTFERTAYVFENNSWLPLESAAADKIIGLSYENFRRTIIIPQGKFQEFLQLTDKHRTDMLKEIFQLDKYEFFFQTASLDKKNNEAIQNLKGRLSHYEAATQELIAEKELLVKELSDSLKQQRDLLTEQKTEADKQEARKKLFDDLELSRRQLTTMLADEQRHEEYSRKISDYDYCQKHFKDNLSRKKELEISISKRRQAIVELTSSYNTCCTELDELQKASVVINEAFLKQDEQKEILNDYRLILQLLQLKDSIGILKSRTDQGQMHVDRALAEKNASENKLIELKAQLRAQKGAVPDLAQLGELRNWFVKKDLVCRNIESLRKELSGLEDQIHAVSKDIHAQLTHPALGNVEKGDSPNYYTEQVRELRKEVQEKQIALHNQVAQYNMQVKLGEFSSRLNNEDPCMLCGSTHHPSVLRVEDVEESIALTQEEIDRQRNLDHSYETILNQLSGFIQREQYLVQQAEDVRQKLIKEITTEKSLVEAFHWTPYTIEDKEKVETAFLNAGKLQSALIALETSIDEEEKVLSAAGKDHEKFKAAIEGLNGQLIAIVAESKTLESQVRKVNLPAHMHLSQQEIQSRADELGIHISKVKTQFEQQNTKINDHGLLKASLLERKSSAVSTLADEEEKFEAVEKAIKGALESSTYKDCDEVISILGDTFDYEELKIQVSSYRERLYAARQLFADLEKKTNGESFDSEAYGLLLDSIKELTGACEQLNTHFIKESSAFEQLSRQYQQKLLLEEEHAKLQHRAGNLATLKNLFKGSGFVSYISSVYLQNLCLAANERFYKLTRQQLQLEVTDKNDFQVRDFLNNGKVRSVKTLSGGQTFQASLSLALALAESVQQQNKADQNFFFLDEGFGSLDKESLQVAFDTLKSLRKENRIVGIISHVEELQQEIDVYLKVQNDPVKGSNIAGSWES
ncbi:AAA family ATPase [Flavihumibacter sp. R14]|nr:AAA family ATPase [Flavihumibacter soli]